MVFAAVLASVYFACVLTLFAVYWHGWLLRGHAMWLDQLHRSSADGDRKP